MPLSLASIGSKQEILKIKGQEKIKKHLMSLGFIEGQEISIVSELNGNVIVSVKDSRVAISKEMANKIIVRG